MARQGRSSTGGGPPIGLDAGKRAGTGQLEASPRIDDIVRVAGWRVRRLGKLPSFDDVAGGAYIVYNEVLSEPAASDLLRLPIVIRGHHCVGLRSKDKSACRVVGETFDPNSIVVDDTTN